MLVLAVLGLTVTCTLTSGLPLEELQKSTDFDHYVFTQEYPAGFCYFYKAEGKGYECFYPQNSTSWIIHGLWPTLGTTRGPNYCTSSTFDPSVVQPLLPRLVSKWTNLLNDTGFYSFWDHEYTKHGTCSGLQEYDFFVQVLNLFDKIGNYGDALSHGNVQPDNQNTYDVEHMRSAFNSVYSVTPTLQCKKANNYMVLQQVEMCLDKSFRPMECPDGDSGSCYGQVLYPESMYSKH